MNTYYFLPEGISKSRKVCHFEYRSSIGGRVRAKVIASRRDIALRCSTRLTATIAIHSMI